MRRPSRPWWSLFRAVRLLLACAVLWIATAPTVAPAAEVWTETAVLVAEATQRATAAATPLATTPRRAGAKRPRAATPLPFPLPLSPAASPVAATRHLVLVPDLYLHDCALLC